MATKKYRLLVTVGDVQDKLETRVNELGISASEYIRQLINLDYKYEHGERIRFVDECKQCIQKKEVGSSSK
jgi:hypothetical protein